MAFKLTLVVTLTLCFFTLPATAEFAHILS
jgi:hypothetical protein